MSDGVLEATFAELAHALCAERAPALMSRLVGFQVLDQDEDETRAVGVFGFKLDEKNWLYAPAFFMNGRIKGLDMLYVRNQDLFVPLQDDWVSFLLSRGLVELGQPEDMTISELRTRMPNFSLINQAPSKSASADADLAAFRSDCRMLKKSFGEKPAGFDAKMISESLPFVMDLRGMVAKAPIAGAELAKIASQNVAVKAALLHYYGSMRDLLPDPVKVEEQYRKVAAAQAKRVDLRAMASGIAKKAEDNGTVTFIGEKQLPWFKLAMTESEVTKVVLGDMVVRDGRKVANQVVNEDETTTRTTPTDNEECKLILADGSTRDCYVATNVTPISYAVSKDVSMVLTLDDLNPWECGLYPRKSLVVQVKPKTDQPRNKIRSKAVAVSEAEKGKNYCVLFPNGSVSPIFQVASKEVTESGINIRVSIDDDVKSGDGSARFRVYRAPEGTVNRYMSTPHRLYREDRKNQSDHSTDFVTIDGKSYRWYNSSDYWLLSFRDDISESKPAVSTAGCVMSSELKLIPIGALCDDTRDERDNLPVDGSVLWDPVVNPALSTFTVNKEASNRYVIGVGDRSSGGLPYLQALGRLVKYAGLREDDARFILERQEAYKKTQYRVKKAVEVDEAKLSAPWPSDENNIFSDVLGLQATESYEKNEPVPGLANQSNRDAYNIWRDPEVKQVLQAAQSGKKEVFDTAMVGSLAKTIDVSALIDEYTPDLMRGMDRVARVLFLFYWHLDKFQERYGRQDVVELEDALKNTFKSQGDLILFLKRKTVDASPELQSMEMGIGGIAG